MSYARLLICLLACLLLAASLTACGKKPSHVDAPSGVDDDTYPNLYPDPGTDPKPTYKP